MAAKRGRPKAKLSIENSDDYDLNDLDVCKSLVHKLVEDCKLESRHARRVLAEAVVTQIILSKDVTRKIKNGENPTSEDYRACASFGSNVVKILGAMQLDRLPADDGEDEF